MPRSDARKSEVFLMGQKTVLALVLSTLIAGAMMLHAYLNCLKFYGTELLPFWTMLTGVALCSFAMIILYTLSGNKGTPLIPLLVGLYIFSLTLLTMYTSRFMKINGSDIIAEYAVAKQTYIDGRWPLALVDVTNVAGSLSVTILPALTSMILGIKPDNFFQYIVPLVSAFIPILVFLNVNQIFHERKIAYLSSFLYAANYWGINLLTSLAREQIATVLLLSAIYCIFKSENKKLKILSIPFLSGVIFSHYTVSYYGLILVFIYLLTPWVAIKITSLIRAKKHRVPLFEKIVTKELFVLFIVATLSWLIFVIYNVFLKYVDLAHKVTLSILGLYSTTPHWLFQAAAKPITPSLGCLVTTLWHDLLIVLIIIGTVYALVKFLVDSKKAAWTFSSLAIIGSIFLSLVVPAISRAIYPDRFMAFGYLFFSTMLALILLRIVHWKKLMVLLVVFLLIYPSINMGLATHETSLLYHSEQIFTPEQLAIQTPLYSYDYEFGDWISNYISPQKTISTDLLGSIIAGMIASHENIIQESSPSFQNGETGTKFLIVHSFFIHNKVWAVYNEINKQRVATLSNVSFNELCYNNNVIYSNGYCVLLMHEQETRL